MVGRGGNGRVPLSEEGHSVHFPVALGYATRSTNPPDLILVFVVFVWCFGVVSWFDKESVFGPRRRMEWEAGKRVWRSSGYYILTIFLRRLPPPPLSSINPRDLLLFFRAHTNGRDHQQLIPLSYWLASFRRKTGQKAHQETYHPILLIADWFTLLLVVYWSLTSSKPSVSTVEVTLHHRHTQIHPAAFCYGAEIIVCEFERGKGQEKVVEKFNKMKKKRIFPIR